jgi:hypothetical protein
MSIGKTGSPTRTAEEREIARFFYESSPVAWNRIVRRVAAEEGFSNFGSDVRLWPCSFTTQVNHFLVLLVGLRFVSNSFKIRLYSSAQLEARSKP